MHRIFALSDGTGQTAEMAVRAGLTQFEESQTIIERRGEIRTEEQVLDVVLKAAEVGGFIVHTVVSSELRGCVGRLGRLHNVRTIDLMGPLLAQLTTQLSDEPSERPGLLRELNEEYFRRIEAMEFALRHDDGQRASELEAAEIVLVGVSRTFKTPLSIYLAFKGWFVGNVPIILDMPLPKVLPQLSPHKVFGLTTDAYHLSHLRRARHDHFGGATGDYASLDFVHREVVNANRLFQANPGWSVVEVTNKPIEEIGSEVLATIRQAAIKAGPAGSG